MGPCFCDHPVIILHDNVGSYVHSTVFKASPKPPKGVLFLTLIVNVIQLEFERVVKKTLDEAEEESK